MIVLNSPHHSRCGPVRGCGITSVFYINDLFLVLFMNVVPCCIELSLIGVSRWAIPALILLAIAYTVKIVAEVTCTDLVFKRRCTHS